MSRFGNYIKRLGKSIDGEIQRQTAFFLPRGRNLVYLDVGCDDGKKTLRRAGAIGTKDVLGFEKIAKRADLAKKRGVKIFVSDLNKPWPLPTGSVDVITATEVIEHLIDLDNFLGEANRVLKKGGTIVISTENLASYHNVFSLILGNQPYTGPFLSRKYPIGHRPNADYWESSISSKMDPHLNVMTAKSLESLLSFYGFKIEKTLGIGFYPLPFPLYNLFSKFDKYHASYVLIKAKKMKKPK